MQTQSMTSQHAPVSTRTVQQNASFNGAIPEVYDRCLGPVLFDFSARDIAQRVAASVGEAARVLEVASGTGIATEQIWRSLSSDSTIVATDLNQAMLDVAARLRGHLTGVEYRQADACDLPFGDAEFDAVVCQYGFMFFPDKARALSEMTRVLKPGGRVVFNVWDNVEENRAICVARDVIASFFEADPPKFLETPFGDYDCYANSELVRGAGFSDVRVSVVSARVETKLTELARGVVCGNPGVFEISERASADPETIVAAVTRAFEREFGSGRPLTPWQAFVFEATKPAA